MCYRENCWRRCRHIRVKKNRWLLAMHSYACTIFLLRFSSRNRKVAANIPCSCRHSVHVYARQLELGRKTCLRDSEWALKFHQLWQVYCISLHACTHGCVPLHRWCLQDAEYGEHWKEDERWTMKQNFYLSGPQNRLRKSSRSGFSTCNVWIMQLSKALKILRVCIGLSYFSEGYW